MLRTLFIRLLVFWYILLVGPPLLVYTLITRNADPIYWAGVKGVMFLSGRLACGFTSGASSVSLRTFAFFVANHTSSADAPAVVSPFLEGSPFSKRITLHGLSWGKPFWRRSSSRQSKRFGNGNFSVEKATEALKVGQSFLIYPEGTRQCGWPPAGIQKRCGYDGD